MHMSQCYVIGSNNHTVSSLLLNSLASKHRVDMLTVTTMQTIII